MVKRGLFPVGGVVAGRTLPAVVIGRLVLVVAGLTVCRAGSGMVKSDVLPGIGVMTGSAIPLEMVERLDRGVTGFALIWGAGIIAVGMALFTLQSSMLPG